ncbi:hypothetical protein GCM10009828_021550 [Actinoplanes couchii]
MMGGSVYQADAEMGFQLAHGSRESGLSYVQPGRCTGNGALMSDGKESA